MHLNIATKTWKGIIGSQQVPVLFCAVLCSVLTSLYVFELAQMGDSQLLPGTTDNNERLTSFPRSSGVGGLLPHSSSVFYLWLKQV